MGTLRSRVPGLRSVVALTALVAVGGTALSVAVAAALAAGQRGVAEQQLDRRARQAQESVTAEAGRYVDTLRTVAAAAGSFNELTAEKFRGFTAPLASMRLAGVTSIAYLVPATESQIPAVQAFWRSRGAKGLQLTPAGTAAEHLFSVLATPLDGSVVSGVSIDVSQAPAPTAALNESRRSGQPAVSDAYHLLRDSHLPESQRQMSFVLTAPVYGLDSGPGGRAFRGWVLMGLRGQNFAAATLQRVSQRLLDIDLRALNSNQEQVSVARLTAPVHGRRDITRDVSLTVADRRWQLQLAAHGRALPGAGSGMPATVAIGGSAVSYLLATLVAVLATGRRRARAQVEAATAGLAAAELEARDHAGVLGRELARREAIEADLRRARDDLDAQRAFLAQVLDALEPSVLTCDNDGAIVHANRSARAAVPGADAPKTIAERAQALGYEHPDGTPVEPADLPLLRSLRGELVTSMELVTHAPDGSVRFVVVHSRPLRHGDGHITGAVASAYDITQLRERENELRAFAGVVAHDLKSPLSSIAGYAELVEDDLGDGASPDLLRPQVERIRRGVDRMRTLIDDLLTYATARDAPLDSQPVDLADVVDDVVHERTAHLRATGTDGTPVLFPDIYIGPLPLVHADRGMIRQLIDNLVGNALKYTAPGQPARIDISAHRHDDRWAVTIADRGIGIPLADQPHIFASFHRAAAHSGYQGTGLGLAICERIVTRHGGTIAATENPGGGTRFTFTLPTVAPDDTLAAAPVNQETSLTGK
ncbi:ATP-binding protein [Paractinoplanes globisporus]|uniref:Sensor-like histidine kinase SenX3 n=1 Tax=Paractinoplanes globisporus TaxID=113565 RepID=A0ABW6W9K9_9ACTN|nr:ATP-binding protein [Actinoplanes globisporus]